MIKENGLRIGDLIEFDGEVIKTSIIDLTILSNLNLQKNNELYKPILLTEEWLVKFGFKKDGTSSRNSDYYCIGHNDSKLCFDYADFRDDWGFYIEYTDSPFEEDENKKYCVSFGIKYVHQLQNLYFALTGKELK